MRKNIRFASKQLPVTTVKFKETIFEQTNSTPQIIDFSQIPTQYDFFLQQERMYFAHMKQKYDEYLEEKERKKKEEQERLRKLKEAHAAKMADLERIRVQREKDYAEYLKSQERFKEKTFFKTSNKNEDFSYKTANNDGFVKDSPFSFQTKSSESKFSDNSSNTAKIQEAVENLQKISKRFKNLNNTVAVEKKKFYDVQDLPQHFLRAKAFADGYRPEGREFGNLRF